MFFEKNQKKKTLRFLYEKKIDENFSYKKNLKDFQKNEFHQFCDIPSMECGYNYKVIFHQFCDNYVGIFNN